MVDPLSVTIGIGIALVAALAAFGLYAAGQRPEYIVDMREVSAYERHVAANEALRQDVDDDETQQ